MKKNVLIALAATAVVAAGALSPASAQGLKWTKVKIGEGIKPALAVDAKGVPHIAFLTEEFSGAAFYATNKSGKWTVETVASGYFYGPIDIDVTDDGTPYIAYHDHEAKTFNRSLGAGVVNWPEAGIWKTARIKHPGHDQWDADIAVQNDGVWHLAGIDPSQFGSRDGVEYATNAFGAIRVENVGSGPQPYEFGVSIETGPGGTVGITYFDAGGQDLRYAQRGPGAGGKWRNTTVDAKGDTGRYSDLAYDAGGNPHISYLTFTSDSAGTVRHAWRDTAGKWQTEDVGPLRGVSTGQTNARKVTNIEIDGQGRPHIMYGGTDDIIYAVKTGAAWKIETAFKSGGKRLGQLVEFDLDNKGQPHVTYFEVTSSRPLGGNIIYGFGRK